MNRNSYNLLTPELGDQVSGSLLRRIAEDIDSRMLLVASSLSAGRNPQLCILRPSTTQAMTAGTNDVNFGTTVYSTPGDANGGTLIRPSDGDFSAGIYLVGCYLDMTTSGTFTGISLNLRVNDPRGPAFHEAYGVNNYEQTPGTTTRGREIVTCNSLVEIRMPMFGVHTATITPYLTIVGTGTATNQTTSRLWAWRIRSLNNA